jgi:glutamate racemase
MVGTITRTRHVGILATAGTVASQSYVIEIKKLFPDITIVQEACPMWVPLLENNEFEGEGADYFIKQHMDRIRAADRLIDTIVLGCTHYTLLQPKISRYVSKDTRLISQGVIVAKSLADYLIRHPEMAERCSQQGRRDFYTSETAEFFERLAPLFYGRGIQCRHKAGAYPE